MKETADSRQLGLPRLSPIQSLQPIRPMPGTEDRNSTTVERAELTGEDSQRVAAPVKKTKGEVASPVSSVVSPARGPSLFLRSCRLRPGVPPLSRRSILQSFGVGVRSSRCPLWSYRASRRRRRREGHGPSDSFGLKVKFALSPPQYLIAI